MNELRPGLPPLPPNVAKLVVDARGYPVPKFVAWIDGKPDFRVIDPVFRERAITHGLCWICGERRPRKYAFVIGPMCAVNRISSEPPSCIECADFAARACPFLTMPKMRRNEAGLPEDRIEPAGIHISRNPGVALVWVTRGFRFIPDGEGSILFKVGEPKEVRWYAHGRPATRAEVLESIDGGRCLLEGAARKEGAAAMAAYSKMLNAALDLMPAA